MNITVVESTRIDSIDEVIDAIETYGVDNVELLSGQTVVISSHRRNFDDAEKYVKLAQIANNKVLAPIFNSLVAYHESVSYINLLANKFGVSYEEMLDKFINIAIEKSVYFDYLPTNISIELLNKVAEAKLVRLYYVENIKSIDLDFVIKYQDGLDLSSVRRESKNPEVISYIEQIIDGEDE